MSQAPDASGGEAKVVEMGRFLLVVSELVHGGGKKNAAAIDRRSANG